MLKGGGESNTAVGKWHVTQRELVDIHYSAGELWNHRANREKQNTKDHVLHNSIYMKYLE